MNHGDSYPCLARLRQLFIIFAQPPASTYPAKSSFDYPPAWQNFKVMTVFWSLYDLQHPASESASPILQLTSIPAVSPDQFKPGKSSTKLGQHKLCSVTVLDVCSVNHYRHKQSYSVNYDVALAPADLLACIITPRPPFSVVFTDWLSMIAALGVGSRPSICRTFGRNDSSIRSQVPSLRHSLKYHQTVPHGGKSWGTMRQDMPPRDTYKIPLIISRMFTLRRRPPGLAGGSNGSNCFHWASVKSLGYVLRSITLHYHTSHTPSKRPPNFLTLRPQSKGLVAMGQRSIN